MKSKRSVLLTLPILLMPFTLTSCDKYSYSDPNKMIKNMWSDNVRLAFPYADESTNTFSILYRIPEGYTKVCEMSDIDNIIIDGFKKVKSFKKVDKINPTTDKRIFFSFNHQISRESVSLTYFTLYQDGNLFCNLFYPDAESNTHNKTINYTFDAEIATEIYDNCYAEFDKAKVELEEFPNNTISLSHFINTIDQEGNIGEGFSDTRGIRRVVYDDNKEINNELKKLLSEVAPENKVTEFPLTDWGTEGFEYRAYNNEYKGDRYFEYNGKMFTIYRVEMNEDGTYLRVSFDGYNKYHMQAELDDFYRINPEIGKEVVNNVQDIIERIYNNK